MADRGRRKRSRGAGRPGSPPKPRARRQEPSAGRPEGPAPDHGLNVTTLVLRAAFMDASVYQEIRANRATLLWSIGVVIAVGVLIAIGQRGVELGLLRDQHPILWFVLRVDIVVIGWLLWAGVAKLFGGWVFRGDASFSQLLRALGIATAPAVLLAFSEIDLPLMGQTVGEALWLFGLLWTLAIGTQAVKETMRLNWLQAILPGFLGWIIAWLLMLNFVLYPASAIVEIPPPDDGAPAVSDQL